MSATWIITTFVIIDDLMVKYGHQTDCCSHVSDSEILTIAVCAAKICQNHHEPTVVLMQQLGYLSGQLSVSRFNRRLHKLADWFELILAVLTLNLSHWVLRLIRILIQYCLQTRYACSRPFLILAVLRIDVKANPQAYDTFGGINQGRGQVTIV